MIDQERFYSALGGRIRQERHKLDITQETLARKLSLNRTSITNIEKGKQKILIHTLIEIAEVFGLDPSDLLPVPNLFRHSLSVNSLAPKGASLKQKDFLKLVLKQSGGSTKYESSQKIHRKTS